jgi:hypothetical protein
MKHNKTKLLEHTNSCEIGNHAKKFLYRVGAKGDGADNFPEAP